MSYEDDLRADPLALAKTYSFFPADKARGFKLTDDVNPKALKGDFTGFNRSYVKNDKKIAHVKLSLATSSRGRECLMVEPDLKGDTGVPVYYLPWDDKGAAVRMSIPDDDPMKAEQEHPKIFFTAILSGCSIIFKGTQQHPTIYHCGTAGGEVGTATPSDTSKYTNSDHFFRQMLSGHGYRPVLGQINKTDYMIPSKGSGGEAVAAVEQQFLQSIQQQEQFKRGFILKSVVSWGTCFGFRNGRDWEFYLQENGTIYYDTVKWDTVTRQKQVDKKTFFGSKTVTQDYVTTAKVVTPGQPISRPIMLKKVFPGTGMATNTPSWALLRL